MHATPCLQQGSDGLQEHMVTTFGACRNPSVSYSQLTLSNPKTGDCASPTPLIPSWCISMQVMSNCTKYGKKEWRLPSLKEHSATRIILTTPYPQPAARGSEVGSHMLVPKRSSSGIHLQLQSRSTGPGTQRQLRGVSIADMGTPGPACEGDFHAMSSKSLSTHSGSLSHEWPWRSCREHEGSEVECLSASRHTATQRTMHKTRVVQP